MRETGLCCSTLSTYVPSATFEGRSVRLPNPSLQNYEEHPTLRVVPITPLSRTRWNDATSRAAFERTPALACFFPSPALRTEATCFVPPSPPCLRFHVRFLLSDAFERFVHVFDAHDRPAHPRERTCARGWMDVPSIHNRHPSPLLQGR